MMTLSSNIALLSFLLSISLTIDKRFQIPSGSLPLRGFSKFVYSKDATGAVDGRCKELTSLVVELYNGKRGENVNKSAGYCGST